MSLVDNLIKIYPVTMLGIYLHAVFLSITLGAPFVIICLILLWIRSGNGLYLRAIKTITGVLVINFAAGAVTGTLVEFGLVQAWPGMIFIISTVGLVPFTLELVAFVGEIVLLVLFIITIGKIRPIWSISIMSVYFIFAAFSGAVITSVNSWMNVPWGTGEYMRLFYPFLPSFGPVVVSEESLLTFRAYLLSVGSASQIIQDQTASQLVGKFLHDPFVALASPYNLVSVLHNVTAAIIIGMSIILAGYTYSYIRNKRNETMTIIRSFLPILVVLLVVQPVVFGDLMGKMVAAYQPTKFAAIERIYQTRQDPLLGFLAYNDPNAKLLGFDEMLERCNELRGVKLGERLSYALKIPVEDSVYQLDLGEICRRDVLDAQSKASILNPTYYVKIGGGVAALIGALGLMFTLYNLGPLSSIVRRLIKLLGERVSMSILVVLVLVGAILSATIGWFVREVGRKPWTIYGYIYPDEVITPVPVDTSILALFTAVFLLIGAVSLTAMYIVSTREGKFSEILRRTNKNE